MKRQYKEQRADETDSSISSSEDDDKSEEHSVGASKAKGKRNKIVRKYDSDFIRYGFIQSPQNNDLPQCVVCLQVLSNESLKPNKLKRHLDTKHSELKNKTKEYFVRKAEEFVKQRKCFKTVLSITEKALKASYAVALRIARAKKAHTIGEDLILPAAMDICEIMIGHDESQKLKSIPLSDDTVRRRIVEMSDDVKFQLLARLQKVDFALQLDESTDIAGESQLLVYVRFIHEREICEDFLFCKPLPTRSTGEQVFAMLNDFINSSGLQWTQCLAVCTDGAASMTGRHTGLVARIRAVAPHIMSTHCMIHREALASKHLSNDFAEILSDCVKIVNFIKAKPLNNRLFAKLCAESGAEHKHLLLHAEVRWLSRGKVIERLFELRSELLEFLTQYNVDLAGKVADDLWLLKLAYLADIFSQLNILNTSMQGEESNILKSTDKITAFKKKLRIWKTRIQNGITEMFTTLTEYLNETNMVLTDNMVSSITEHLHVMAEYFDNYFPTENIGTHDWIRNPFQCELTDLTGREEEELAELASDRTLQMTFAQQTLTSFWCSVSQEYPLLHKKAMHILLPFATTYLCETAFSMLTIMKTKYRSRLNVEDDMRLCLSKISPRIDKLCSRRQAHPSH